MRVFVVDDSARMREWFCRILERDRDIAIVGQAANGKEAIEKLDAVSPDVVVMDVNMPVMGGIEATCTIKETWPDVVVVGCTSADVATAAREMARAGASAFFDKAVADRVLILLVRGFGKKIIHLDEPAKDPAKPDVDRR